MSPLMVVQVSFVLRHLSTKFALEYFVLQMVPNVSCEQVQGIMTLVAYPANQWLFLGFVLL